MPPAFAPWFRANTGHTPHPWQAALAAVPRCGNRLIRIPTGMGKTLGVLAAWSYHRLVRGDSGWPRRLVLCLPMRVLVEQTEAVAREWLRGLGRLWDQAASERPGASEVGVHLLLGGAASRDWHLFPEHEAILVGTQDMLLSRALNRGYGSPRGRWPMECALLRQDALWVLDEVQLMDVGLRTSVQLQAFAGRGVTRPLHSWWMSATLQPSWLSSVDFADELGSLRERALTVPADERVGKLFDAHKPVTVEAIPARDDRRCASWAATVLRAHEGAARGGSGRLTLAIANTVDDAHALHRALEERLTKAKNGTASIQLHLIHSRFRGRERARWRDTILSRSASQSGADRILVTTQVVEAGVDISADALVTALAPWPSLVQRFGRAARYGGAASIVVVDRGLSGRAAAPYEEGELVAARQVLAGVSDVGLASLEALEGRLAEEDPESLARLYPYQPAHTLTADEHAELFDTGPDLTGSDLDISRFIRSGEERDLQVWWWPVERDTDPLPALQPMREALCPVPVAAARSWLGPGLRAWWWSYLDGAWRRLTRTADLRPGMLVLVDAAAGGYLPARGFVGSDSRAPVPCDEADRQGRGTCGALAQRLFAADNAQEHDDLSELSGYKTIAFHGAEAGDEARALARAFDLAAPLARLLELAARLHDLGKAHPIFQEAIVARAPAVAARVDLAKAPATAWRRGATIYRRPGFRHELASTLALLEALYQAAPLHEALLRSHRALVELGVLDVDKAHLEAARPPARGALRELAELDADGFNLVLYLVCAHHGKVRGSWQATPHDQGASQDPERGLPLRGVAEGDALPAVEVAAENGEVAQLPVLTLHLDAAALGLSPRYGASWRERVNALRQRFGDATLLLLESLLRVADVRASQRQTEDPALAQEVAR